MKRKLSFGTLVLPVLFLFFFSSCKKEVGDLTSDELIDSSPAVAVSGGTEGRMLETDLLKSVRQSTSRFHSTTLAVQAGYTPTDHCVSSPAGGMGYHWVNGPLVDGVFNPLIPEVVMYTKGPGGNLRLIAVEYLVINVGQPAPMFGNQAFRVGGAPIPVPHWTLHVWVHEANPSGTFAPFNPNITCP